MTSHDYNHLVATAGSPTEFWEKLYGGQERLWSGAPNPLLVETADALTPGRALDLGCGEGGDAVWLARRGWQVTAVDIAAPALERTASHAAEAGVADRVATEQHDLAVTFPAGVFDLVSAQYFQSPFGLPRAEVLRKAARGLAPGGLLLVVEHGPVDTGEPHAHAGAHFAGPEEIHGELALDPAEWSAVRLDQPRRQATRPNGETWTLTDTVVVVRRAG
ncbi:SAM-dependent methyltransferase [Yinghuangia sp. YIM S10712]|uniref:SAM-dependent methyltransferase n=1 Tax=Yinghuangia sp. YIM S10712 TaxID=3436930 RepID=UPI003F52DC85